MQSAWYGEFARRAAAKREQYVTTLVGGGAKSYEEYKGLVGYIAAIDELLHVAHEVDRHMLGIPDAPGASPPNN